MARWLTCLALLLGSTLARAADDATAEEVSREVDRELGESTHIPPPTLEIRFEGIDSVHYELVEATFILDGKPIAHPLKPGKLGRERGNLFFGIVAPGPHAFSAELVLKDAGSQSLFGYADNHRFRVAQDVTLQAERGLLLRLRTWIQANDAAPDLAKRLKFIAKLEPQMVAKLEDAKLLEPPRPSLAPSTPPSDAGGSAAIAARANPGPPLLAPSTSPPKKHIPASFRRALAGPTDEATKKKRLNSPPKSLLERLRAPEPQ